MKTLAEKIAEALEVINGLDKTCLEVGKYPVNDDFYYMVQEYMSKDPAVARYEAHEKYVDIQYVISGFESVRITPVSALTVSEPYKEEKDVVFFEAPARAAEAVLKDGGYVILYPEDAHQPGVRVGESVPVKKIVGKVRV